MREKTKIEIITSSHNPLDCLAYTLGCMYFLFKAKLKEFSSKDFWIK